MRMLIDMLSDIIDLVGEPAVLENLAEECTELAQAALKLARIERGENPTPKSKNECVQAVMSEYADVLACITILKELKWWNSQALFNMKIQKLERWMNRLEGVADVGKGDKG